MPPVDVYVDILFLVNLGMDALCLIVTGRLLHRRSSMLRLLLSAALGGVYGVVALFWEVGSIPALLLDVAVCFLMCGLAFGKAKLPITGGVYALTSMVMGGIMTALYHWLNRAGASELLPGGEEGLSSVAFVLLALLGGLFTALWGRIFRRAESRRASRVLLTVTVEGHTFTADGMIDSGNLMTDPLSGLPVVAVRETLLLPLLSPRLQVLLGTTPLPADELTELPEAGRLHLIPADTATGQGLLVAIRPESLIISDGGSAPRSIRALITPVPLEGAPADAMVPSSLLL